MKLYTYFRAQELAKEFYERESRNYYGSFDETYHQKCMQRTRQCQTIRDGLIKRMERVESQNAEQKDALKELAEIIMVAKLKMGRLDRFANLIFAPDVLFEMWLGEEENDL